LSEKLNQVTFDNTSTYTPFQMSPNPTQNFSSHLLKTPPGLMYNARPKNVGFQTHKKNFSMMSYTESTHDSENVTNTLTSSNSGHLETFANLGKSELNSSGKLDSSMGFEIFL